MTFITGGATAESVTVIARGSTEHVVDELERALNDALDTVIAALDAGGVVPGAGATEIAIADHIRSEAASIGAASSSPSKRSPTPSTCCPEPSRNRASTPSTRSSTSARTRERGHRRHHREGQTGVVGDPVEHGILDPAAVKREAVDSATEAATMIVRIDDVISSS